MTTATKLLTPTLIYMVVVQYERDAHQQDTSGAQVWDRVCRQSTPTATTAGK